MVVFRFDENSKREEIVWYCGNAEPLSRSMIQDIVEIQADGHEVEVITNCFRNLMLSYNPVKFFYGDIAKTIAGNLFVKRFGA